MIKIIERDYNKTLKEQHAEIKKQYGAKNIIDMLVFGNNIHVIIKGD